MEKPISVYKILHGLSKTSTIYITNPYIYMLIVRGLVIILEWLLQELKERQGLINGSANRITNLMMKLKFQTI